MPAPHDEQKPDVAQQQAAGHRCDRDVRGRPRRGERRDRNDVRRKRYAGDPDRVASRLGRDGAEPQPRLDDGVRATECGEGIQPRTEPVVDRKPRCAAPDDEQGQDGHQVPDAAQVGP
jgi:hypothetical protein